MEDTVSFIQLFVGELPFRVIHYREAFKQIAGIDYVHASEDDLFQYLQQQNISVYHGICDEGKDALLNLILTSIIEPLLGDQELTILAYYPESQSALAQKQWFGDEQVAERFEVYFHGVELANGYHELTDPKEQRRRFCEANQERERLGKEALPIDENFLTALERGLPNCCGVAVGFDRLMMLRHQEKEIAKVMPFSWDIA
jgi:elongation factor P--(R)-beta-lysine ligase